MADGLQAEAPRPAAKSPASEAVALDVVSSLSQRRWIWRDAPPRLGEAIAQCHALPEIVGRLLAMRGVGIDAAADYLVPTMRALLPDPATLIDMEVAAARIAAAIESRETVAVFGDYDVDGACASAILVLLLRSLGCIVHAHVPDRMTEGYGPNIIALRGLVAKGARLIVCVDCGTAAGDILHALNGQADIVVLDHHKSEGPPPRVIATVNPNRLDCASGLGHLCAAAIAFLTAVAVIRVLRRTGFFQTRKEPDLIGLLDLVALATVCDVMPLTGLNRALVTQGLKIMSRRGRPGIAALLEVAQAKDMPSAHTLGFVLGPRINAAGRISEADLGLRLLLSDDPVEARALAATLDAINRTRQEVEAAILDAAIAQAARQIDAGHPAILVAGSQWHPGVVGIIAGRLRERFNRPACVAGLADGTAKGSGRSVPGLDLGTVVIAARQAGLLSSGGGHAMAAGFVMAASKLERFHAFLCERLSGASHLPKASDLPIEGTVSVGGCSVDLATQIARLAPFGTGNEEPVLVVPRARVVRADRIGRELATIRAFVEDEGGGRLKAIMFRAKEGPLAAALMERGGMPIHLAGHLRAEEWNGLVSASFIVTDVAQCAPA